jgi:hypothetical protein
MRLLFALIIFLLPRFGFGQVTQKDSTDIKEACQNYVEGFYTANAKRIAKGVHPELVKRIVNKWGDDYKIDNMGATSLMVTAQHAKKPEDLNPQIPFSVTVWIYDIAQDIACTKIINNKMNFFDYVQLGKLNG